MLNRAFSAVERFLRRCARPLKQPVIRYFCRRIHIYDRAETARRVAAGASMARFGDGELGIALWKYGPRFQRSDPNLKRRLCEVLQSPPDENLLVCLPGALRTLDNLETDIADFWRGWLFHSGTTVLPRIPRNKVYGDSFISRLYLPYVDKSGEQAIVDGIRSAYAGKNVVLVEGQATRFGVGNDLLAGAKSVRRILCPAENAFDRYDEIFNACVQARGEVYLLALGPTATVLAYDLYRAGFRALDLGHMDLMYEYMARGATKDERVARFKYDNEMAGGNVVEDCRDEAYLSQIYRRIGVPLPHGDRPAAS